MMMKLSDVFDVQYGHSLSLNQMELASPRDGIPFISRKMRDNGVAAYVKELANIPPNIAGELTCALSGNGILTTFVQDRPYYTAYHIACLTPKFEFTTLEKLFYCTCIRFNKFRYSWGRQANRSVRGILVPSPKEIPPWVSEGSVSEMLRGELGDLATLSSPPVGGLTDRIGEDRVPVRKLFKLKYGHSLELNRLAQIPEGVNFVSRTRENNGVSARVSSPEGYEAAPAGLITVACGGSVMEAFLQLDPFFSGRDIYWLEAIDNLTVEEKMFYCVCIRANRFRYNYGRQANKTLATLLVPARSAIPSWVYGSAGRLAREWRQQLLMDD